MSNEYTYNNNNNYYFQYLKKYICYFATGTSRPSSSKNNNCSILPPTQPIETDTMINPLLAQHHHKQYQQQQQQYHQQQYQQMAHQPYQQNPQTVHQPQHQHHQQHPQATHHQHHHYQQHQQQQHNHVHQQQQQQRQQNQQQQNVPAITPAAVNPVVTPVFNGVNQNYPGLRQIYYDPPIYIVDNFLNENETQFLIDAASDSFTPAPVVGVGAGVISETRTSSTCYLTREDLPELSRKVSILTQKPINHLELPQVGRYYTSQQYLPHYDAFDTEEVDGKRFASNGGQRTVTVLIYLNTVQQGGQTSFPKLNNVNVQPVRGQALIFFPATIDGHLDPRTLHAALPAIDTKFVSQIWIRQGN
jgi:prolyl 4-hydroxylase